MTHTITIDEGQRQLALLALSQLSLQRAGWNYALRELAQRFPEGVEMYEAFRTINADFVDGSIKPWERNVKVQTEKEIDILLERFDKTEPKLQRQIVAELVERLDFVKQQNTILLDKARGDFWLWQGDGEDHLESLVCPVLIRANDLLALVKAPSNVAETCAKIVETFLPGERNPATALRGAVEEIRRYAADLAKPENMRAAR